MGIDLSLTTLAYELAAHTAEAHSVILRPECWAIRGASRMGRALTQSDLVDEHTPLTPVQLAAGTETGRALIAMLQKSEPELALSELTAKEAFEEEGFFEKLDPEGLEFVLSIAHAIQAGIPIPKDITLAALLPLVSEPPRIAQRSEGPMSALLAASMNTLWLPTAMRYAWDGPFGTLASLPRLRQDIAMLPSLLFTYDENEPSLHGAQQVTDAFVNALRAAGDNQSVAMSG